MMARYEGKGNGHRQQSREMEREWNAAGSALGGKLPWRVVKKVAHAPSRVPDLAHLASSRRVAIAAFRRNGR